MHIVTTIINIWHNPPALFNEKSYLHVIIILYKIMYPGFFLPDIKKDIFVLNIHFNDYHKFSHLDLPLFIIHLLLDIYIVFKWLTIINSIAAFTFYIKPFS